MLEYTHCIHNHDAHSEGVTMERTNHCFLRHTDHHTYESISDRTSEHISMGTYNYLHKPTNCRHKVKVHLKYSHCLTVKTMASLLCAPTPYIGAIFHPRIHER